VGDDRSRMIVFCAVAVALTLLAMVGYTTWAVHNEEHQWCTVIELVVKAAPPKGPPGKNPSRAYLQALHAAFTERAEELGCT
jgi:hypothetical protein